MMGSKKNTAEFEIDLCEIDEIVARIGGKAKDTLNILLSIQEKYRYLPQEALRRVCEITEITPARITGVSTFYSQFRHKPVGKHIIRVCHGTACYVLGAERITDAVRKYLDIEDEEDTDADRLFTVQKVACLGCCSLAPCLMIDDITYGHLTPQNTHRAIANFVRDYGE
ncbi:MAG: NAD(P)H-dependent oxidoreductase subunit E [Planctomycetota bacterium]